ncbi:MAG: tetratricopeptide repeat protein [Gammaproteobacteria bacterium]|nr:tetratricopeptide repeat protein [Gammaproteobacteria bacterium]MCP5136526.1 tetratricopeptide repeat protein [Gammaproteobacteria bacterium]
MKLHERGQYTQSRLAYKTVLASAPDHPDALHMGGLVAFQLGDHREALMLIRKAIQSRPHVAAYRNSYAEVLRQSGDLAGALSQLDQALMVDPGNPKFLNTRGLILHALGRVDEAQETLETAVRCQPDDAASQNNLGNILRQRGDMVGARKALMRADELAPNNPIVMTNLGLLHQEISDNKEAEAYYRRALAVQPNYLLAHVNLGNLLRAQSNMAEAIKHYWTAVDLAPENADIWSDLALALEASNDLNGSDRAVSKALKLKPGHPVALTVRACLHRRGGELAKARAMLEAIPEGALNRALERFALSNLGQIYERMGDYDAAWNAFMRVNMLARTSPEFAAYDIQAPRRMIARQIASLVSPHIDDWTIAPPGLAHPSPVFFIGFPRSGTTLIEHVLGAHSRVLALDETSALPGLDEALSQDVSYPESLGRMSAAELDDLRERYWQAIPMPADRSRGEMLVVDKMPMNLMHMLLAFRLFPNAKVLIALRDPRDACLSCLFQDFELNNAMGNFLTLEDTVSFYAEVMGLWLRTDKTLGQVSLRFRYEDVIRNLEHVARELIRFVGLEWEDPIMGYRTHTKDKVINTPSYQQVIQPIYKSSVARWKHYEGHMAPGLATLSPFVTEFGYEQADTPVTPTPDPEISQPVTQPPGMMTIA